MFLFLLLDHRIGLQVVFLELFFDGAGLNCQAGLRRSRVFFSTAYQLVLLCLLLAPRRGFRSAFYRRWLGFWVTRKLQVYPYDITTEASRLGLTHHYVASVTSDREYCSSGGSCMTLAHLYGPVGGWKPAAPSRTEMFKPDWRIRLEMTGLNP